MTVVPKALLLEAAFSDWRRGSCRREQEWERREEGDAGEERAEKARLRAAGALALHALAAYEDIERTAAREVEEVVGVSIVVATNCRFSSGPATERMPMAAESVTRVE